MLFYNTEFSAFHSRFSFFILTFPPFLSCKSKCFEVSFTNSHIVVPPFICVPAERSLDGCSWQSRGFKKFEGHIEYLRLHQKIHGFPAGIAQREIIEKKSGDTTLFDDISSRSHDDGWDSSFFKGPGCQAHDLVTNGSDRDKQQSIYIIFPAPIQYLICVLEGSPLTIIGGYPIKTFGNRTDFLLRNFSFQGF